MRQAHWRPLAHREKRGLRRYLMWGPRYLTIERTRDGLEMLVITGIRHGWMRGLRP